MGSQAQSKQNLSSQHSRQAELAQKRSPTAAHQAAPGPERPLGALAALNPELLQPQDLHLLQRTAGNQAATALVQAKLVVGPAGDIYENEADRIAEQVTERRFSTPAGLAVAAARVTPLAANEGGIEVSGALEARLRAGESGGAPLPADLRRQMEERFGRDFGGVRLHTDSLAEQLNRELRARAFTHGRDIFLGRKAADPATPAGQRLLAHELTHVVQQTGQAVSASAVQAPIQRLRENEDPEFLRRLRRIRQEANPDDEEALANYDEQISAFDPKNKAFQQKRIGERSQEIREVSDIIQDRQSLNDPKYQAFMQRRINQRGQEAQNAGTSGARKTGWGALEYRELRREAARNRQGGVLEDIGDNWLNAYTGYAGSAISLGGNISGTVSAYDDKNKGAAYVGSGLGILGGTISSVSSGLQLASSFSKMSRAQRLMSSKSRAARMMGRDLSDEVSQGALEQSFGLLGGLTGIGGSTASIFSTADTENKTAAGFGIGLGAASATFNVANEGASLFGVGRKYSRGAQRSKAAATFAAENKDEELKAMASRTQKSQKSGWSLFGNVLKSGLNVGANVLNVISSVIPDSGLLKGGLALAGTVAGGTGSVVGGLQTEIEREKGSKLKKQASTDAGALLGKLQNGDAGAAKFASDVLEIPGADKLAEEDPDTLKELIASRMTQFAAT